MIRMSGDNNFLQAVQGASWRGDSPRVIDNPLTCQGALCNRRIRSERQGDSPRVIDNPLTRQGALCNRRERQGDSQCAVDTDLDHESITTVQNP